MDKQEFKKIRKFLGLKQSELALELEVGQATISRYEIGTREIPEEVSELMKLKHKNRIQEIIKMYPKAKAS